MMKFESWKFNAGRYGTLMHYHIDALLRQDIDALM